ncbi:MAG: hypothetical protein AB2L07_07165 [Thermoanaerobaculaceae bacterium]
MPDGFQSPPAFELKLTGSTCVYTGAKPNTLSWVSPSTFQLKYFPSRPPVFCATQTQSSLCSIQRARMYSPVLSTPTR